MSAPVSNIDYADTFILAHNGVQTARAVDENIDVGVFIYYQWGVGVLTCDFGTWINHSDGDPNCVLAKVGDDRYMVRTLKNLPRNTLVTIDYQYAPWFVACPPRNVVVPLTVREKPVIYAIGDSSIHGRGMMANKDLVPETEIGVFVRFEWWVVPIITREFGRHINHSWNPNTRLEWKPTQEWILTSVESIARGSEITFDYRTTSWYCKKPPPDFK